MNTKVIGVDEVGRGCIAGPIVCASFSMDAHLIYLIHKLAKQEYLNTSNNRSKKLYKRLTKITYYDIIQIGLLGKKPSLKIKNLDLKTLSLVFDSKKITENNRKKIANYLINIGIWGIGVVSNSIIDLKGIQYANKLAMLKSIYKHFNAGEFSKNTNYHLFTDHLDPRGIDYKINNNFNLVTKDKMDSKSFVTACASIIAKVYRDYLMEEYSKIYNNFSFSKHVGYGTKTHFEELKKYGKCKIHRTSFLKNYSDF